jgi:hypothetical protein
MAVSLILKNSSVEDRHPTANQLTNGEISLNYNEAGAFLSCRDTNGDIQQIGGVKIDDAPPGSPSKQALWFQPSTGKLFIYDGAGWLVVASGGDTDLGLGVVDAVSVEVTSSTGSNVQLPAATGTTAGLLTAADKLIIDESVPTWELNGSILQPVDDTYDVEIGGGNISLNADGSATLAGGFCQISSNGQVEVRRDGNLYQGRKGDGTYVFTVEVDGTVKLGEMGGKVVLDGRYGWAQFADYVHIGGTLPSAPNISLNADGSATFAGIAQSGGTDLSSTTSAGVNLNPAGQLVIQRTTSSGSNALLWRGYSGDTQTSSITSGGSAEFAGAATFGGDPLSGANDGVLIDGAGTVRASRPAGSQKLWDGYTTGISTPTSVIYADGSAEFTGDVVAGTGSYSTGDNAALHPLGSVSASRTGTNVVWAGYTTGNSVATSSINALGAAQFADYVHIGGTLPSAPNISLNADGRATFQGTVQSTERTITAGAFDLATGNYWTCGAITVPVPTNAAGGTSGLVRITAGPVTWDPVFKFPGGSAPTIASFPAIIPFYVESASVFLMGNIAEGIA